MHPKAFSKLYVVVEILQLTGHGFYDSGGKGDKICVLLFPFME